MCVNKQNYNLEFYLNSETDAYGHCFSEKEFLENSCFGSLGYTCGNEPENVSSSFYQTPPGTEIDRNDTLLYNGVQNTSYMLKNSDEEADLMSFAGIVVYADLGMIIGFADSKSSIELSTGLIEEPGKRQVTKIFKGENFIITFIGTNAFTIIENDNYSILHLDDWVKTHIKNCHTPYRLILELRDFLHTNVFDQKYSVIIQAVFLTEDRIPLSTNATINDVAFSCKHEIIEKYNVLTSGANKYIDEFKKRPYLLFETDIQKLKANLEMVCNEFDQLPEYNPVKNPWIIETITY